MKGRDNYEYMTAGSVPRTICELAVPTIISMLVTAIYNVADTYFVGRIVSVEPSAMQSGPRKIMPVIAMTVPAANEENRPIVAMVSACPVFLAPSILEI